MFIDLITIAYGITNAPKPPAEGEPKAGAEDGCEKEPKPGDAPKAGAVAAAAAPKIEPPDAEVLAVVEPPNMEPPEAPKPPEAVCCVGEPKILPPSAGLVAAAAAPNIEPAVFADAVEPKGLAALPPPPNMEPAAVEPPNPVDEPPPKILPPVAAGDLVAAAVAPNKPVPKTD
ncbi:hypothetical protein FF38_00485 [Lucilia cuprina]|uniref:Uncharacterized protein n=1 Tax=Lucilia cuprina TaxID=7375 RepID=A0A0L0CJB5_LUCCU|nr:hypothetical protein FF38_00485 [Lucilia cuprina]